MRREKTQPLPWLLSSKESPCNAGDSDSIPGSGRSTGRDHGNPLQYSCMKNPTDRGAWRATVHKESLCSFRLYYQVNQVYAHIYPLPLGSPSQPTPTPPHPSRSSQSTELSPLSHFWTSLCFSFFICHERKARLPAKWDHTSRNLDEHLAQPVLL